ncbi:MAG: N-(5'-phosphoribosyl)anthranilate isomerase, partial [Candidatus Sericytochromatia bacterium]
ALPQKLWKVGVFVNASYDEMAGIAETAGLTHLQLHGDESPELCLRLQQNGFAVIKALRLKRPEDLQTLAKFSEPVLLDAAVPGHWGGSGQLADWELAARAAGLRRCLLAGGLSPDNLQAAWTQVRPWGLDLSSGVESAPGIKDAAKLKDLFKKARQAENADFDRP